MKSWIHWQACGMVVCLLAAINARAEGFATGFLETNLTELRLLGASGDPMSLADFSAVDYLYRAKLTLTGAGGRSEIVTGGPSTSPVDLDRACIGPGCGPLVHAAADQQMTGAMLGSNNGLAIHETASAASINGIGGPFGRWTGTAASAVTMDFRLVSAQAVTIAFNSYTTYYLLNNNFEGDDYIHARTGFSLVLEDLGSDRAWTLAPKELNLDIDSRRDRSQLGYPPHEQAPSFTLVTDVLDTTSSYRLTLSTFTSMDAQTLSEIPPVPETGTFAMYAAGLAGIWLRMRSSRSVSTGGLMSSS